MDAIFDLLERRDGIWRIIKGTAIYEKDRIDPVDPGSILKAFFANIDFSAFPTSAKFLGYDLLRRGLTPSTDLISVYNAEETALTQAGEAWLAKS